MSVAQSVVVMITCVMICLIEVFWDKMQIFVNVTSKLLSHDPSEKLRSCVGVTGIPQWSPADDRVRQSREQDDLAI